MNYSIRHQTRFKYSAPISQSLMEVRMHPVTEGSQTCISFDLSISPKARVFEYRDHLNNVVHNFDIADRHSQLTLIAESLVSISNSLSLPDWIESDSWNEIDAMRTRPDLYDLLAPSEFVRSSRQLVRLREELECDRRRDPMTLLRSIAAGIHDSFEYCQETTQVDSPIEKALFRRRGVCQDFTHIMIGIARDLGIPCRYVSGYLSHQAGKPDRSAPDATHAWCETLLPGLGWVGFDPTNAMIASERHIRVAVGRDYADVAPTRGVFKGDAQSSLSVAVRVHPAEGPEPEPMALESAPLPSQPLLDSWRAQQEQQQQ